MNILIVAGGTGSIALQTGLYDFLDSKIEGVNIKVLVNAYDNGLSTGMVRKVVGGRILGPSDVRKNQTTRFKLQTPNSPYHEFLDRRFSATPKGAHEYCIKRVEQLRDALLEKTRTTDAPFNPEEIKILNDIAIITGAINHFFSFSAASQIDYNDFSLANIVYAGLAAQNKNSLREAARIMAGVLGIKDNVILNDDTSLFLGAITASGKRITDEGDIVSWNNPEDPIVKLFYVDENGHDSFPMLCDEASEAIEEADYIILSSGTQWSSLIPTYDSIGWVKSINATSARVLMVMNRCPDKDAPNQSASEIIKTLVPRYFPEGKLEVIVDSTGHELMRAINDDAERLVKHVDYFDIEGYTSQTKHDPLKLARAVAKTIHRDVLDAAAYIFDYDDTLVGRGNSHPVASRLNTQKLIDLNETDHKVFVCSGNGIKAIHLISNPIFNGDLQRRTITVFADGGINEYEYSPRGSFEEAEFVSARFKRCLDPSSRFSEQGAGSAASIIETLRAAGIPASKIENRGNVMISVKPIDPEYRDAILTLIRHLLRDEHNRSGLGVEYSIRSAGRTTIEINLPGLSKIAAVEKVLGMVPSKKKVVYVGDEFLGGNDSPIYDLASTDEQLVFWPVKSPTDTAFFLITLSQLAPWEKGATKTEANVSK